MRKTTHAAVLAIVALLAGWAPAAIACKGASRAAGHQTAKSARHAIRCLINRRRARHGLPALSGDSRLAAAAEEHSGAMIARNFFSHDGSDGTPASRAAAAGYLAGARSWSIGEDLGWGVGRAGSPRTMVRAWMASAEHRAILLDSAWREIGVGLAHGSPTGPDRWGMATYTVDLAFRHPR